MFMLLFHHATPHALVLPFRCCVRHYACKWERWSDLFGSRYIDDSPAGHQHATGCLIPDEMGTCRDDMNMALWQVAANLLCNS